MTIDPAQSKLASEHKHDAPLLSCAFDASGRFLFAGGRDRGLVVEVQRERGRRQADALETGAHDRVVLEPHRLGRQLLQDRGGFGERGLPVGLHLVGNYFAEARMLQVANHFQRATDWHTRAPEGWS